MIKALARLFCRCPQFPPHEHKLHREERHVHAEYVFGGGTLNDVIVLERCETCPYTRRYWKWGSGPKHWESFTPGK